MNEKEFIIPLSELFAAEGVHFFPNGGGELILEKCYNCGRSKKMYIEEETGRHICHRCGAKGGAVHLVAKLLNCNYGKAYFLLYGKSGPKSLKEVESQKLVIQITGHKSARKHKKELPSPIKLPSYMVPLKQSHYEAWKYLKGRGLSDEVIKELDLYVWEAQNRVVFTVTIDGEIYGTISRDYIGNQELKVLNSKGNFRSFTVWNYDNVKESSEIVIAEGIISALKAGGVDKGIALFGKKATPEQLELIKSLNAKKVYICLDVGTDKEQQEIVKALTMYFPRAIYKIDLPHVIKVPKEEKLWPKDKFASKEEFDSFMESLFSKMNEQFKIEMSLLKDKNKIYLPYDDRMRIFSTAKVIENLEKEEKKKRLTSYLESHKFTDQKERNFIMWLMFSSEYIDAGDYSFEEMDAFRASAKLFKSGPSSWI